jgi:hypothetical protein
MALRGITSVVRQQRVIAGSLKQIRAISSSSKLLGGHGDDHHHGPVGFEPPFHRLPSPSKPVSKSVMNLFLFLVLM